MVLFHSSSVTSTVGSEAPGMNAAQTRMSIGPSSCSTRTTDASTSAESATSPTMESALSPALPDRSSVATRVPRAESRLVVAAPMPLEPPVTSAILPDGSRMRHPTPRPRHGSFATASISTISPGASAAPTVVRAGYGCVKNSR